MADDCHGGMGFLHHLGRPTGLNRINIVVGKYKKIVGSGYKLLSAS